MRYIKKHWLHILLLVALFTSLTIPALADMPVIQPAGGGAGLWEVDGTETQLIIADDIDMQTQKIINLVDPAANQDASTKKYVDDSIDTDVSTHAALTATHGVAEIAGIADITTHAALTATHGVTGTILGTEDVDDTPVDAATTDPISSNWAFDHDADGSIHTTITTATVTLYVDAGSGSDENAGTSGSPKATIKGALDALPVVIAHACTIKVRGPQNYAESNTALDFSRFSTLSLITLEAVNSNDEDMFDNGLCTNAANGADDLDDSGASWSADQFNGAYLMIYRGTGEGQIRTILDTEATRIVISTGATDWTTNPDNTSYYAVIGGASLTGTDSTHAHVSGKNVEFYGFRHTGATSYDVHCDSGALVYNYNSYHESGNTGFLTNTGAFGYAYYNWYDGTTSGVQIQTATMYPRASVFYGMTYGCRINYGGLGVMYAYGDAQENYFDTCTTGISVVTGSGCAAALTSEFNNCGTPVSKDASSWFT